MNFIVIISDTLRRDHLRCYGNSCVRTDHIGRFADDALIFDRAYSASFPTVPHRRDVMTGRFTAAYSDWAPLGADETVLAQVLSEHGYTTMMVCDCPHILENGYHFDRGFDGFEWIRGQESDRWRTAPSAPAYRADPGKIRTPKWIQRYHRRNIAGRQRESDTFVARTATAACAWLEENYRERFFLYLDIFDPHEPWDAPQWYVDMYDPGYSGQVVDYPRYDYADYLTTDEIRHCRALYAAEVTLVDRWMGRVLEKVGDLGLMEDTLVILTTDHGFLLGEHNFIGKSLIREQADGSVSFSYIPLYEEINHIPLIIRCPGRTSGRTSAIVQPQDLMPTLLDLAGIEKPESADGRSFAEVLKGTSASHRPFAISTGYLESPAAAVTVVKDQWAAVLTPRGHNYTRPADKAVDGVAKKVTGRVVTSDMLFDLDRDPGQEQDISGSYSTTLDELRDGLVRELQRVYATDRVIERWR